MRIWLLPPVIAGLHGPLVCAFSVCGVCAEHGRVKTRSENIKAYFIALPILYFGGRDFCLLESGGWPYVMLVRPPVTAGLSSPLVVAFPLLPSLCVSSLITSAGGVGVEITIGGLSANFLYTTACATNKSAANAVSRIHRGIGAFLSMIHSTNRKTLRSKKVIPSQLPNSGQR